MTKQIEQQGTVCRWVSMAFMASVVSLGFVAACNTNPAKFIDSTGQIEQNIITSATKQQKMDILWVVDNSGSMCQEQKVLRDNFDKFIDKIKDTSLDFHIGLTTTHVPGSKVPATQVIVAKPFQLQSEPQPVPGFDRSCKVDEDAAGGVSYQPVLDALDGALDCLADQSKRGEFNWTNQQVACIDDKLGDCGVPDRNGDSRETLDDLFPLRSEYRQIPKVLTSEDYSTNGGLDVARLKADFACMSLVGTRGDGFERGLLAAVEAVNPELTGKALGAEDADPSAPNHGLVRQDAGFTLIFVTDENDCSARDEAIPSVNACSADLCDFYNSSALSEEESPLYKISDLARNFRENLAKTKGRDISDGEILVASIHGQSKRFDAPVPDSAACTNAVNSEGRAKLGNGLISCEPAGLGAARSGDRYARFIREFANYYPENRPGTDGSNINEADIGWLCAGDFSPALEAIGEFIVQGDPACIKDDVFPCDDSAQCPAMPFTGEAGSCVANPHPEKSTSYCDSALALQLTLTAPDAARFGDISANPYCEPASIQGNTCLVSKSRYELVACQAAVGMTFQWSGVTDVQAGQELTGYQLNLRYNATVGDRNK